VASLGGGCTARGGDERSESVASGARVESMVNGAERQRRRQAATLNGTWLHGEGKMKSSLASLMGSSQRIRRR
jgi:hypothetical protein